MAEWTVQKLLGWTTEYFTEKGLDSPRLSAEMLLSFVLELPRIKLYTNFNQPVEQDKLNTLRELVKRAAQKEPVQYLVGSTEFYSLKIELDKSCLIPRPETELLVERAIEYLRQSDGRKCVCDLCTGSGCIAVAVAKNYEQADIVATDISDSALKWAGRNIKNHKLSDRVKLLCGDLFDALIDQLDDTQFDLIVSNPPYVTTEEFAGLDEKIKKYEPKNALLAGADGLDIYRRIAEQAPGYLKKGAPLMVETGYRQGQAVMDLLEQTGEFTEIEKEKDLNDNDRIVTARKT
jgi:release factor glutamine methyltransferase